MTLKEACERAGLSVKDVSLALDVHINSVKGWMEGKKPPTPQTFRHFCELCGANPKEVIVKGKNDMVPLTLSAARYNAGYTIEGVASTLGCSYGTLQSMEYNKRFIPNETKIKLCELYNVTPEMLGWKVRQKKEEDQMKRETITATEKDTTGAYDWNPGAPEITEQDRMTMDLACAQEEAERYRLMYNASEERVTQLEDELKSKDDVLRAALEVNAERLQENNDLNEIIEVMQKDINRLNHLVLELKAECYDYIKNSTPF